MHNAQSLTPGSLCLPVQLLNPTIHGKEWLVEMTKQAMSTSDSCLDIPLQSDGSKFCFADLEADQMSSALYIMKGIHEYLHHPDRFKPIRMTISGKAGCGKTHFLKTVVSIVRNMFQSRRSALVCAPTGAAAFGSGGCTIHHMCGIYSGNIKSVAMTDTEKERFRDTFLDTIILFLDEFSMLESAVLGKAERVIAQCTRDGLYSEENWGGIPIIVFIGDVMQLPSYRSGIFSLPVGPVADRDSSKVLTQLEARGQQLFMEAAKDVMVLRTIKRQDDSEKEFTEVLENLRNDCMTDRNVRFLKQFHLQNGSWTPDEIKEVTKGAMYAFSTNAEAREKNISMLAETSSTSNPVAKVQCCYPITPRDCGKAVLRHFQNSKTPTVSLLCIGAQVAISGRNFHPRWGLYNGAKGEVEEVVFAPGKDPNNGDRPDYVVVNFPCYIGPAWDKNNPRVSVSCRV